MNAQRDRRAGRRVEGVKEGLNTKLLKKILAEYSAADLRRFAGAALDELTRRTKKHAA